MRRVSIFGVRVDDLTSDELRARLLECVNANAPSLVVTPNPEFLLEARKNEPFRSILNAGTISIPDGVALRFAAAAIAKTHNLHRYPGVDVLPMIATMCRDRGLPLVLLGATDVILAQAKLRFATLAEGVSIVTMNPGIIDAENPCLSEAIVEHLRNLGPCCIAIALGQGGGRSQGKQEIVAQQIVESVSNARIVIGVGGALNMIAGSVRRAPMIFRRLGMEWLWRLVLEPWRFQRIFRAVILFPALVFWDTIQMNRWRGALIDVAVELRSHFFSRS